MTHLSAKEAGLIACHRCDQLNRAALNDTTRASRRRQARCTHCGAALHSRTPNSIARTWALLIAAAILYIPANLLPIMRTRSLLGSQDDTLISGILFFWTSGSWALAIIVFVASVMVPLLKLAALGLLAFTTQCGTRWRPLQRAQLYRLVERIGRWSMLDIFVIMLTVALIRFGALAEITAGSGALAFGAVVVLTILASMQFDPRLMWDTIETWENRHDAP